MNRLSFFAAACISLVLSSGSALAQPFLVTIEPVVLQAESGLDSTTGSAPASDTMISLGSTFYIELWAQQLDPALAGLACVFADLSFDDSVMSCVGTSAAPDFGVLATGSCIPGQVDNLGGCNFFAGAGVAPEWARIATVEMTADLPSVGNTIDSEPAVTTISIVAFGNVPVGQIQFTASPPFGIPCSVDADCDDGNECTDDLCTNNVCSNPPEVSGTNCGDPSDTECDNPDTCDGSGFCQSNHEPSGAPCTDDGNECTDDMCDGSGTCTHPDAPDETPCTEDGNECTDDVCITGLCAHPAVAPGTPCGDPTETDCDHADTCDLAGVCQSNIEADGTPCADDGNECTDDGCNAGICSHPPFPPGTPCGDPRNSDCDNPDTCDGLGACLANFEPPATECRPAAGVCDVAEACTGGDPDCPPDTFEPDDTPCPDGSFCNGDETCQTGVCVDGPDPCIDLAHCDEVADVCVCVSDDECVDGDSCTEDACVDGVCEHVPIPGCVPCNDDSDCDDGNECTLDLCIGGVCEHLPLGAGTPCQDDGNECTTDVCDAAGVCTHPPLPPGTACGDPTDTDCDHPDTCDAFATCQPNVDPDGTPCTNDGVECTDDLCNGGVCVHPNLAAGTPCGDPSDSECDDPDTCDGLGQCMDNLEPPTTECRPASNDCDAPEFCTGTGPDCPPDGFAPDGTPCADDGNECTDDVCSTGNCTHHDVPAGVACGDPSDTDCDNPDTCDGLGICGENWEPDGTPCDDGDHCTENDECTEGICAGTLIPGCRTTNRVSTDKKGSLLIYPKVEIKWDAAGAVTQDTFISILNDYPDDVFVHWYFVNGDAPLDAVYGGDPEALIERAHPGWNWVNRVTMMTQNEPTYFSAVTGMPAGAQPFTSLDDEGGVLGRLDPDGPVGSRVLRGYMVAYAIDNLGNEISWNHLSGGATIVNYADQAALEYNAYAAQAMAALGDWTDGTPGELHLDAIEYDTLFDMLLLDFYAVGSDVFSGGGASIMLDTDLTLLPVMMDLTQDTPGPVTTKAHFDIWNENEDSMSGATHCVTCWDQTLLSQHGATNFFGSNLQTDKGKARIDGMASTMCEESIDAPLLGVSWKILAFSGATTARAHAGMTLVGQGEEAGFILTDIIAPPDTLVDGPDSDSVGRTLRTSWSRGK